MTSTARYDGRWLPGGPVPLATGGWYVGTPFASVSPALVLAARRGFVEAYVIKGLGWFENEQAATDFFDDRVEEDHWSRKAYEDYAAMDPHKADK